MLRFSAWGVTEPVSHSVTSIISTLDDRLAGNVFVKHVDECEWRRVWKDAAERRRLSPRRKRDNWKFLTFQKRPSRNVDLITKWNRFPCLCPPVGSLPLFRCGIFKLARNVLLSNCCLGGQFQMSSSFTCSYCFLGRLVCLAPVRMSTVTRIFEDCSVNTVVFALALSYHRTKKGSFTKSNKRRWHFMTIIDERPHFVCVAPLANCWKNWECCSHSIITRENGQNSI